MTGAHDTRAALLEALRANRPALSEIAERLARAVPPEERAEVDEAGTEQFLNAFEALMVEALEESGSDHRTFIFESAIPAMVAQGQTPMLLLGGHVAYFILLSIRLASAVPEGQREAAEDWLAAYFADYARESTEFALRAEREAS